MSDPFSGSETDTPRMRVESADYELRWPPALLIRELTTLDGIYNASDRVPMVERLLEEAFLGEAPLEDYRRSSSRASVSISASRRHDYVAGLRATATRASPAGTLLVEAPQPRSRRTTITPANLAAGA